LGELEDLGACVEQRDGFEGEAGALGDAAHLLDVGGIECGHLRHELGHQLPNRRGVERETIQLSRVVLDAQMNAPGGLAAVRAPPLARGPGDFDERKCLGHRLFGTEPPAQRSILNFWNAWVPSGTWPRLAAKVHVTSLTYTSPRESTAMPCGAAKLPAAVGSGPPQRASTAPLPS